jgi:hypothetical protein
MNRGSFVHFNSVRLLSSTFLGHIKSNYHDQKTVAPPDLEDFLGRSKHKLNL